MHRVVDYCSDRVWMVVAIIILVMSSYVVMGRYLAASVQNYRSEAIELIEQRTGMHAEIGGLSGGWVFFTPVIEISDVHFYRHSGANRPIISAKKITLEIDVLASLLVWEPRLVKLNVHGLDLTLQRSAEGHYNLPGSKPVTSAPQSSTGFLSVLLHQEFITLQNSKITLSLKDGSSLIISDLDIGLKRFAGFYQLTASTEMSGQALRFVTEIKGHPLEWETNQADFYLRIGSGDILRWLPESVLDKLAKRSELAIKRWQAGTEVWGRWENGQLHSLRGKLNNDLLEVRYKSAKNPLIFSQLNSQFQLDLDDKKNVQLQLQGFGFNLNSSVWPKGDIRVNLNSSAKTADVQLEYGELASLSVLLLHSGILNTPLQEMFETLELEGGVQKTVLHIEKESEQAFYLSTVLTDVYCKQWKTIPAVEGLSGEIQVSPQSGLIHINSEQLSVDSPKYFRQKLSVDKLQGPVAWFIEEEKVMVQSGNLIVSNADVSGTTIFSVKVPLSKEKHQQKHASKQQQEESPLEGDAAENRVAQITAASNTPNRAHEGAELYLTAHFDDVAAQALSSYLPPALPEDVLQWLDAGLLEGHLNGRLLYHGSLNWKNPLAQHTLQSDLNFINTSLDYLPNNWPFISQANGSLFIDESDVFFTVQDGLVWDSKVEISHGFVGKSLKWPFAHVDLAGTYISPMPDALRLLNETPLKDIVGGNAQTWQGSGRVTGELSLSVPLVKNDEEMEIDVLARFHQAKLSLSDFNLVFSNLNGQLSYNNSDGLYSDAMQAYLFGYPAEITLPKFQLGDGTLFRLDLDSKIALRTLAEWSEQPILTFMEGVIDYHAELHIVNPDAVTTILRIRSDTEGMQVNLPSPFEKSKEQARETLFQMLTQGGAIHYYIHQAHIFDANLKMNDSKLETMTMVIGEEIEIAEISSGVSIYGKLNHLEWDVWERDLTLLSDRYEELEAEGVSGATDFIGPIQESPSFIDMISGIDLKVEQFDGFGLQLANVDTHVIRNDQSWWVNASSPTLKGVFKVPDDNRPIVFDLDYFHIPEEESEEIVSAAPANLVARVDESILDMTPAEFPAISAKIADLQIDGWKLGQWHFTGSPFGETYRINDLEVKLADQTLKAKAVWRQEGMTSVTEFSGMASGKDVGKLMAVWGQEPTMESKSSAFNFTYSWPFSPLDFSFDTLSGKANIKITDGRFLDVGAASAIRILGILNFSEVRRRLRLDFGDLIKAGHSFDHIEGPMFFYQGELELKGLRVKSPSSKMAFNGNVNLLDDSLDLTMDVELEITKNLVAIAALVGGPAAGGGMFIIDRLIGDRLAKIASLKYTVKGTLDEPEMRLKPF